MTNIKKELKKTVEEQEKAVQQRNALVEQIKNLELDIIRRDGKIKALRDLSK